MTHYCNVNFAETRTYFDGKVATINVIAQKEIFDFRGRSTNFKQLDQVKKLTMNIATNLTS